MGLGTFSEFRVALLGALLAAAVGAFMWTHHEGYEACRAPQKAAEKAQVEKDLADAKGTIHDLEQRLAAIPAAQPAPHVLLCQPPRGVRTGTTPGGTQPLLATTTRDSPGGVPSGAPGIDIGRELQDAREAASIIAIYRDETFDWALKQAGH